MDKGPVCPCVDDFHEDCFVGDNEFICHCFWFANPVPS